MIQANDNGPERKSRSPRRRGRWRVVLLAAVLGVTAIYLGVPQFMAGFHLGPRDDTLRDIAAGRNVPKTLIETTVESREAALGWVQSGATLSELSILRLAALADARPFSAERRQLVTDAVDFQRRALTLSPADAYGWTRLVQAQALAAVPVRAIEPNLRMAVSLAPNESNLMEMRLNIGLRYWLGLQPATRDKVSGDVRRAALWSPEVLARLARARGLDTQVMRILEGHPLMMARYAYARAHPKTGGR